MALIVKELNMPTCCDDCEFCIKDLDYKQGFCSASTHIQWSKLMLIPHNQCHSDCPLVEIPKEARLIDGKELRKKIISWLPSDPCGVEEKEFPFETDICVSTLMEIDDATIIYEEKESCQ